MKYDRRFDLQLRQDVKDWAETAGTTEQEALVDVLEQRKGSTETAKQERKKQLEGIKWAAVQILQSRIEFEQMQGNLPVSPGYSLRHDLDGDVQIPCGQV